MNAESYGSAPPYKLALAKMLWGAEDAVELGELIDPASFPTKEARDLFRILAVDIPKGATAVTLPAAVATSAKHCVALLDELLGELGTTSWSESNEYLAERVADDGRRGRLARDANEILAAIEEGKPTEDILARSERQRAAIDNASPASARFHLLDDDALEKLPTPEWLIDTILPSGGLIALIGKPKSYKSFLALDWALHIATGLRWHGKSVREGTVVYVYAEGVPGLKKRVAAWKRRDGIGKGILNRVRFLPRRVIMDQSIDPADLLKAIKAQCAETPVLIIIDTLARNMSGDESKSPDMNAFVRGCDVLREATGAAVLIVHHTGHEIQTRGRGSSNLPGAVDTSIICTRDEERIEIACQFQKDDAEFPVLAMDAFQVGESLVLNPVGVNEGLLAGNRLKALTVLQRDFEDGTSNKEWCNAAEMANGSFDNARKWLLARGYVEKKKRKYRVTDAGRQAFTPTPTSLQPNSNSPKPTPLQHTGVYIDPVLEEGLEERPGVFWERRPSSKVAA